MIDIRWIREAPDEVRRRLSLRGAGDEAKISELLGLDEQRRALLTEVEQLKATRNRVSKEIGALLGQKRTAEAETRKQEIRRIGDRISELDRQVAELEQALDTLLWQLPNPPHPRVPAGKSAQDNPVVRTWGELPSFSFKPRTHLELCESLGLVDFTRGAKLTGSGFLLFN